MDSPFVFASDAGDYAAQGQSLGYGTYINTLRASSPSSDRQEVVAWVDENGNVDTYNVYDPDTGNFIRDVDFCRSLSELEYMCDSDNNAQYTPPIETTAPPPNNSPSDPGQENGGNPGAGDTDPGSPGPPAGCDEPQCRNEVQD